jgi:16S rRNA processing protein RimM
MAVADQNGQWLGKLIAIHDFGAGEIAELAVESGPTIMVPFGGDRLLAVDIMAKTIDLSVPSGLLDDVIDVDAPA